MTCVFVWGSPCPLGNSSQFMCQGSDQQAGSSFVDSMGEMPWTPAGHGLTFIGYQVDWQLLFKKYSLIYTYIYAMLSYKCNDLTWTLFFSHTGFIEQWKRSYRYCDVWLEVAVKKNIYMWLCKTTAFESYAELLLFLLFITLIHINSVYILTGNIIRFSLLVP